MFGHGVISILPVEGIHTVDSKIIPMADYTNIGTITFGHSGSFCPPNNTFIQHCCYNFEPNAS